jgi:lipopolysaccharide/colanic/teichoic acid biosynthesis glycosyltransferase
MKRVVDVIGSLAGLVVLTPLTPFIAFAILLEDGAPVFIECKRVSGGKTVKVFKFRSMVKNADKLKVILSRQNERGDGPFFKMKHDPRVTRVGRVLRKFKIDELPQFLNVLKGDLSLVGPRPHEPGEVRHYPKAFKGLTEVRGGLTGPAQATGNAFLPFQRELEMDLAYIENKSLWRDVKIIARTAKVVFRGNGV